MGASCTLAKAEARAAVPAVAFLATPLAGKMLKSYLDGLITAATIAEIVAAVQKNTTHSKIEEWVQRKVQEHVNAVGNLPNDVHLRDLCSEAIATFRMEAPGPAAAEAPSSVAGRAYFSGDLQAVIGGINDMILVDASTVSNDGVELRFKGSYAIRDTYDFDNDRSMFPAYDRYRKDLTTQFASDPFTCMLRFNKDLVDAPTSGGDAKVGPLNKSLVFTCFMYAIEINRCTSPLFWEAEIPFEGMARLRTPVVPPPQPTPVPPTPKPPPPPRPPPIPKKRTPPPRPTPPDLPPPTPTTKSYVVKRGDYLRKIARMFYGDERHWKKIYDANRTTIGANPDLIFPGQVLMIPT